MDPEIVVAIVAGAGTTLLAAAIAFISLVWKMSRWQTEQKERSRELCRRLNEFVDRVDEDHKQTVKDIGGVHERVDEHLRDHSLAAPP